MPKYGSPALRFLSLTVLASLFKRCILLKVFLGYAWVKGFHNLVEMRDRYIDYLNLVAKLHKLAMLSESEAGALSNYIAYVSAGIANAELAAHCILEIGIAGKLCKLVVQKCVDSLNIRHTYVEMKRESLISEICLVYQLRAVGCAYDNALFISRICCSVHLLKKLVCNAYCRAVAVRGTLAEYGFALVNEKNRTVHACAKLCENLAYITLGFAYERAEYV